MPFSFAATAQPISAFWIIPFVLVLGSIALCPLFYKKWWESNYALLVIILAAIGSCRYLSGGAPRLWFDGMSDYVSFIVLMGALYVISGGIVVRINRNVAPIGNCVLLIIGCVAANFLGTTGAAILLIRPYLRANQNRLQPYHIVFFIFVVANIGGALTPIGGVPLFLGYLMGVPFWFIFGNSRWLYILVIVPLLITFFILDQRNTRRSTGTKLREDSKKDNPIRVFGAANFVLIGLVIFAVFQPGFEPIIRKISSDGLRWTTIGNFVACREMLMVWAGVISWVLTPGRLHRDNEFKFAPMREVAIVFLGIFATMVPVVEYLKVHVDQVPLHTPAEFYLSGGLVSAVLDSAPAYKILLETKLSQLPSQEVADAGLSIAQMTAHQTTEIPATVAPGPVRRAIEFAVLNHPADILSGKLSEEKLRVCFLLANPGGSLLILALSAGTVLFGACTYLGNGPNLMVKSIADDFGAPSPNFIRYITHYTLPLLIPMYLVILAVFVFIK